MSLQDKLEALRQVVEAKTVDCPWPQDWAKGTPAEGRHIGSCLCDGTGRIPDPVYNRLLAVIQEQVTDGVSGHSWVQTRNWDRLPQGALTGAMLKALAEMAMDAPEEPGLGWRVYSHLRRSAIFFANDKPDEATVETVLAELEKEDSARDG